MPGHRCHAFWRFFCYIKPLPKSVAPLGVLVTGPLTSETLEVSGLRKTRKTTPSTTGAPRIRSAVAGSLPSNRRRVLEGSWTDRRGVGVGWGRTLGGGAFLVVFCFLRFERSCTYAVFLMMFRSFSWCPMPGSVPGQDRSADALLRGSRKGVEMNLGSVEKALGLGFSLDSPKS